jgi:DNA polymerase-1
MLCRDLSAIKTAAVRLARWPVVALDTETTGLDPLVDQVLLVALSNGEQTVLCDVRGLPRDGLKDALAPVLDGGPVKVMHHAKFDLRMLWSLGLDAFPLADTFLNELILDNGRQDAGHGLSDLSARYLGLALDKQERAGFARVGTQDGFTPAQLEYTRRDVLATWQVFIQQVARVSADGAARVARLEALAVPAVAGMEHAGILVDAVGWRAALSTAQGEMDEARSALNQHFRAVVNVDLLGEVDLNYDAEADVRAALGRLGIHLETVSNEGLRDAGHPAALALLRYREAHKRVSTYGEGFLQYIHPSTGRIHASFRQIGASTGRMSCERPNLQNIPKGSDLRGCVVAPPGRVLITADYAACELRILTHLSQDPVFLRAFEHGEDVHAQVASQVFGVPVSKQQHPELRERAKAISFGLIYGMGAAGLAAQTNTSLPDAEALLHQYFARFPRIADTLRHLETRARDKGYAATVLGRRLYMAPDAWERPSGGASRLARNMPIQGTSADITKLAMAYLHTRLAGTNARLINAVHDELLLEAPQDQADQMALTVAREMERAMAVVVPQVPPKADVRVGTHWSK